MQFDLRQLGRRPGGADEHVDRTFEPSAFAPRPDVDDDYRIAGPVRLVMDLHKEHGAYRVTGRVDARLALQCGRCLEGFEIPVSQDFELRYVAQPEPGGGDEEREIAEDDLTTAFYKDETLDLEDMMREQFQLALPMKPLCTADCRGLCATCGTNLNTGTCSCAPTWEDPRLAALKGLLRKDS